MTNAIEKLNRDLADVRERLRRREQLLKRLQLVEADLRPAVPHLLALSDVEEDCAPFLPLLESAVVP
jgi:hypothetical protein